LGAAILPFASNPVQSIAVPVTSVEEGSRRFEALGVVAVIHTVDPHPSVAGWRMDETGVAQIDADMGERPVAGIEKYQIAGPQELRLDRSAIAGDVGGTALTLTPAARP